MSSRRTKKWRRVLPKIEPTTTEALLLIRLASKAPGRGTVADRYARLVNELREEDG